MRTRVCASVFLLCLCGGVFAPLAAQSLADVARQEAARRKAMKQPSKVLTNKDLHGVPASAPPATTDTSGAAAPAKAGNDTGTEAQGAEKKGGEPVKDQAYWSGRVKALQLQLDRDQTFAEALQSRVSALTTDFVNRADPAQQSQIAANRQKALDELGRLTKQIENDKKAIANLQEDTRRAGIPPDWVR